ncbi:MAG: molecular chaperone HtpG [Phototrophicales bacterium]|nr:MAG: molecular chaperone HtpG [Phototrophicales bacterium]
MSETYTFQAEIKQLLHTLVHSLYTDREIFLRELISNSSDALNRLQFEMLTTRDVRDPEAELAIRILVDKEARTLTIRDTGVGMTHDEVIENLGTISHSGIKSFIEQAKNATNAVEFIGQFGVGFYSIFMVADRVVVHTLSYRPDAKPVKWISDGSETYEVTEGDRETRGTDVILYLKEDADEFLDEGRLRTIIHKHSNYIAFPIYLGDGEEPINDRQAIWRRSPNEVTEEEYYTFYKSLTFDFENPRLYIHTTTDAPVQYYALLYVPAKREPAIFSRRKEPGLQLYARKVLIQDYCTDLLPEYLSFMQGVVDSEDLPLNVSRETVQANRVMVNLKKAITGKVLRELKDFAKRDSEGYAAFWEEFGPFLKQGILIDPDNKERLSSLLRFYSTHSPDKLISLDEYVERMQEVQNQDAIYYILGDNKSTVMNSPHLEPFRARGIEVLFFTETVDSFLINSLFEYNGHRLQNVDDENLDLSDIGTLSEEVDEAEQPPIEGEALSALKERFEKVLGDRVHSVRVSKVLVGTANPARLVSPEGTLDRHTQKVYQLLDREYEVPRKILEFNPRHRIIHNLANLITTGADQSLIDATIEQLYENALLIDGLHPNPAEMVQRIQRLMEVATTSTTVQH